MNNTEQRKPIVSNILRYVIQGVVVALAVFHIPTTVLKTTLRPPTFNEVGLISLISVLTMYILDNPTLLLN
jgi:hypothetical protein